MRIRFGRISIFGLITPIVGSGVNDGLRILILGVNKTTEYMLQKPQGVIL